MNLVRFFLIYLYVLHHILRFHNQISQHHVYDFNVKYFYGHTTLFIGATYL